MKAKSSLTMALILLGSGGMLTPAAPRDDGVHIDVGDKTIDFRVGAELISRYHRDASVAKPFLWPLNGPGGVPLTRAWPMEKGTVGESIDHVHQKSAWFCHGDVIVEGTDLKSNIRGVDGIDFWAESKGHGVIACTFVGKPDRNGNRARVATQNEWRTADGKKVLDETRVIHFIDFGQARMFVFDIDLCASVAPIVFGDTKEGSFGIRINDALREDLGKGKKGTGKLENADGKVGEKTLWGMPSFWCDYSGPLNGKIVGLAIFDDPANPYRAHWHSRGYGLMAANPFGRGRSGFPGLKDRTDLVKLAKGEHLKLRYGLLLHAGDAHEGKVAEYFHRFVKSKE